MTLVRRDWNRCGVFSKGVITWAKMVEGELLSFLAAPLWFSQAYVSGR